jgi:hypothetical protein
MTRTTWRFRPSCVRGERAKAATFLFLSSRTDFSGEGYALLSRSAILRGCAHPTPPPLFASLFSILYPQNTVFIRLRRRCKPLLFNTLQRSSQNPPYKGVTGKIVRNKDLPPRTSSRPSTQQVLKDRLPSPEHQTGGAGDWLPRSQFTMWS